MRKLIYFLAFAMAIQLSANGQKVRGGLKGGVVIADYSDAGDPKKSEAGPAFGIIWNVTTGKYFAFQPQFNFWVQKGYNKTETILNSTITTTSLVVNSCEAQLNYVFRTGGKRANFFVGGGPSVALAINGKWTYNSGGTSSELDVKFGKTGTDDFKKFDFGVTGIAGFYTGVGIMFSVSYNHGLTNLNPKETGGTIQSSYVGINLGFLLPFEQKKK
jgi:hypothetical protein